MKASKPSQPKEVKALVKSAKEALNAHQLRPAVLSKYDQKTPAWKISARSIEVSLKGSIPGHWRVNMGWTLVPVPPRGASLVVTESSIGLYGVKVPGFGGGDKEVCLVRYDVSTTEGGSTLEPLGAHINVHQPGALKDKIHYQLPGLSEHEWQVREVLDFLLSDRLAGDLAGRLS
ncbi:MAG TPA: hypothetical protein VIT89_11835 [Solirubrobacterales bacterium]